MSDTTFIYVLNDPRTNQVRYVGKANDPLKRWKCHISRAKKNDRKNHTTSWMRFLLNLGLTPELEILEEIPMDGWQEIEKEYIRVFRMIGIRLTNAAEGGEGSAMSQDTKAKLSVANTGQKRSVEARENMSKAHLGQPGFWAGKTRPVETREKISGSLMGSPGFWTGKKRPKQSEESQQKRSRSLKLSWAKRKAGGIFLS